MVSSRRSRKGHFSVERANTLAETIGMITTEGLADKIDVAEVETEIALPGAELESGIAAKRSMTWILGAMGLQTVLVIGSLFAFVPMIAK